MGVRFQAERNTLPSDVILHVRMLDKENILSNKRWDHRRQLGLQRLLLHQRPGSVHHVAGDNLGVDRIEVDMINFSGPLFSNVDNRLMSLKACRVRTDECGHVRSEREILQPSEVLHKKQSSSNAGVSDRSRWSTKT
jgi:hypothetical protein